MLKVKEAALLGLLEAGADSATVGAVALEQLVEERLGLAALGAVVEAPLLREVHETPAELLA